MFGKAITYKTTTKCLADNRTTKYEASIGPAESLSDSPTIRQISKTLALGCFYILNLYLEIFVFSQGLGLWVLNTTSKIVQLRIL
jgi:hypothetical protein